MLPVSRWFFCAYNEENALPEKLGNIRELKARYPGLEVLGYSDVSEDRTLEMLQAAEAEGLLTAVPATERLGKAWGMRQLVARATGDVVIFTDANVTLDLDAIDHLSIYFSDPQIGTVAGHLHYLNQSDSATADVGNRYWTLEERIKALESQTGSTMGADGAIFARRRADYPEVPPHLLDDLTASISPLFDGYRVISAPDVVAYERLTTDSRDEYRRKRRIACRAFNTHRYLAPRLREMSGMDRFKYTSHKLLRWFSPMFLAMSGGCAILGLFDVMGIAGLVPLLTGSLVAYVLWKRGDARAQKAGEIILALLATAHGIFESLQGKAYQTWAPAQSRNI
ncbi:glycosyltransferase [Yangia mangrovi]|uniref:Glycosyltransferase n=1 Tax=Alloyangia mangrovi TaxID=1779329 RepID=A0ABT2KQ86_9RHOB|nr:glycosyltransferase [Alloyangia mangrovi]MCT4372281.1 glycosyltransferase [Alloyangia mangrovi]